MEAQNGLEALKKLSRDDFDLAFVDVNMPFLDGIKLIRMMRDDERLREIPIAVISGEGETMDRTRAIRCGADDYLAKPVSADAVLGVVERLLKTV